MLYNNFIFLIPWGGVDRFNRIFMFHEILRNVRHPVPGKVIREKIECSRATFERIKEEMRDFLGAPIEYDRELNGYYYARTGDHPYELPGLWFNASELYALLACQELLSNVQPGLLDCHIAPLQNRIDDILKSERLAPGDVGKRIRILKMAHREMSNNLFQVVADALLQGNRLRIVYHGRERDEKTDREISPQRLAYYRDNWYLDALCHLRNELRSFSIDRVQAAVPLKKKAKPVGERELDEYFAESYGIFAGKPKHVAVLRFKKKIVPWVAGEQWHPGQKSRYVDEEYELEVPFSDPRELVMDILRYSSDVEVISPGSLRREIIRRLDAARRVYE